MKKYHRETWFQVTTGPAINGGKHSIRYYRIRCKRCGRENSYHATGLANDALRKIFIRQKWVIGHNQTQHLCPGCADKPRAVQAAPTPPPPPPEASASGARLAALLTAWHACDDYERNEFLKHAQAKSMKQWPPFQHGPHIDSMPVEAPLPEIEHPPVEIADEAAKSVPVDYTSVLNELNSEEEPEPADWWKKLNP